jgi:hypothetical protein
VAKMNWVGRIIGPFFIGDFMLTEELSKSFQQVLIDGVYVALKNMSIQPEKNQNLSDYFACYGFKERANHSLAYVCFSIIFDGKFQASPILACVGTAATHCLNKFISEVGELIGIECSVSFKETKYKRQVLCIGYHWQINQ